MSAVSVEHAFAVERAVRFYLASIGRRVIPCHEFCGRNGSERGAPLAWTRVGFKADYLILPDFIELSRWAGIDVKTQGYAPFMFRAQARTTGCKKRHYLEYRRYQEITGAPVSLMFVHLCENEIRGGPLDAIDHAKTPDVNYYDHDEWRGDVYWKYDSLPHVFPGVCLDDMLRQARNFCRSLSVHDVYSERDHDSI